MENTYTATEVSTKIDFYGVRYGLKRDILGPTCTLVVNKNPTYNTPFSNILFNNIYIYSQFSAHEIFDHQKSYRFYFSITRETLMINTERKQKPGQRFN